MFPLLVSLFLSSSVQTWERDTLPRKRRRQQQKIIHNKISANVYYACEIRFTKRKLYKNWIVCVVLAKEPTDFHLEFRVFFIVFLVSFHSHSRTSSEWLHTSYGFNVNDDSTNNSTLFFIAFQILRFLGTDNSCLFPTAFRFVITRALDLFLRKRI